MAKATGNFIAGGAGTAPGLAWLGMLALAALAGTLASIRRQEA